jgi:hypothetical protein
VLPQLDGTNMLHGWLPGNWGRDLRDANLGRAELRLNPDVHGAVSLTVPLS